MRYPATETAEKHDRIVQEASRLFRERGFEDVTVAEVMKKAGLTHGPFYSHFESKGRFTATLKEIISAMGGERREAMATLATLVGAISLARAVDDEAFSREILREVQKKLDGEMAG